MNDIASQNGLGNGVVSSALLGWISCRDRLPSESDADTAGDVWWWMPRHADKGAQRDCWDGHYMGDATHWMPRSGRDNDIEQPQFPST
jgi:hypothetical protein